jgi:Transmembrane Fragile-X-F protein
MSARSERDTPVRIPGWLGFALIGAFIALKLAGVTDWSWWWVLSPLWIAAALGVLAVGALLLPFALFTLYVRVRLRFRLRQAFPEVFIDPAALTRIPSDPHPDDH